MTTPDAAPTLAPDPVDPTPATAEVASLAPLDAALVATARHQHGMVSTAQAPQAGLSAPVLVKLVKQGVLRHPGRGLYAVEALVESEPEAWHRQLCAGAF